MYFTARAEGRISYGHLGRTNSCYYSVFSTVRLVHGWNISSHLKQNCYLVEMLFQRVGRASEDGMRIICVEEIGVLWANVCFCYFYTAVTRNPTDYYIIVVIIEIIVF